MTTQFKKLGLLALIALSTAGYAQDDDINAFCDGSVWVIECSAMIVPFEYYTFYTIYSIEGECTLGEHQCLQMYRNEDNQGKTALGGVYREGEKIWFVAQKYDNPVCLLYDFGLEVGEITHVDQPYRWNPGIIYMDSDVRCDGISTITSCGHEYKVFDMTEIGGFADPNYSKGQWIKGLGGVKGPDRNCGFYSMGDGAAKLVQVSINGELVYGTQVLSLDEIEASHAINQTARDLQGRPIPANTRGLIIENGRVVMRR